MKSDTVNPMLQDPTRETCARKAAVQQSTDTDFHPSGTVEAGFMVT